jgi:hypothetical protein
VVEAGRRCESQNNFGEAPIVTTSNDDAIPLCVEQGADLIIRNNQGQNVMEAIKNRKRERQEILGEALRAS